MVYLEFARAFDKVDHGVLLCKIETLGIIGKLGVFQKSLAQTFQNGQ